MLVMHSPRSLDTIIKPEVSSNQATTWLGRYASLSAPSEVVQRHRLCLLSSVERAARESFFTEILFEPRRKYSRYRAQSSTF